MQPTTVPPASYHSVVKLAYRLTTFCGFFRIVTGVSPDAS